MTHIHVPVKWKWLLNESGPRHLVEALNWYGVKEKTGPTDNLQILAWAQEMHVLPVFTSEEVPWCGLFLGYVMHKAGRTPPDNFIRAKSWSSWGGMAGGGAQLGDILVFTRDAGGHVGLYVGEGKIAGLNMYWVLGGNQGDAVSIVAIAQRRLSAVRRPKYISRPINIRRVQIKDDGSQVSNNER